MTNIEEFALLAKKNEEAAWKEIQEVLEKYSCSAHYAENKVDGQIIGAGLFLKFRPEMFMNKGDLKR